MKENKKYKDSVFCDLFYSDQDAKKNLLQLANALLGMDYTDPQVIELLRLEDVLFKDFKNDVAFTVDGRTIVLGEHQSTVNLNMPLRHLLYIAREYERIVSIEDRYRSAQIKIPFPVFYTFYNGERDFPVETVLYLSDAFTGGSDAPQLELKVKVININTDKKHELLEKCDVLRQYSQFVEITRKLKGNRERLKEAIQLCIKKDILTEYLKKNSSEVINMLMAEYDYDMDIAVQRQEAAEEGRKEGHNEGLKEGRNEERRKLIINMLRKKKYDYAEIADNAEVSEEYVKNIEDEIM